MIIDPWVSACHIRLTLARLRWCRNNCLPWKPLLPPSLKVLSIACPNEPLEPDLFYNLGKASHSSLKMLLELNVFLPDDYGWSDEIFDGFNGRVKISIYFRIKW